MKRAKKREVRERKSHEASTRSIISLSLPPVCSPPLSSSPPWCSLNLHPPHPSPWWKLKYSLITGDAEARPSATTCEHMRRGKTNCVYVCLSSCVIHCLQVWSLLCGISSPGQRFMDWIFLLLPSSPAVVIHPPPSPYTPPSSLLPHGCCVTIESS